MRLRYVGGVFIVELMLLFQAFFLGQAVQVPIDTVKLNALMKAAAGGKDGPHPNYPAVDLKLGLPVGQDDRELHRHIGA